MQALSQSCHVNGARMWQDNRWTHARAILLQPCIPMHGDATRSGLGNSGSLAKKVLHTGASGVNATSSKVAASGAAHKGTCKQQATHSKASRKVPMLEFDLRPLARDPKSFYSFLYSAAWVIGRDLSGGASPELTPPPSSGISLNWVLQFHQMTRVSPGACNKLSGSSPHLVRGKMVQKGPTGGFRKIQLVKHEDY
jgi:hypothetical protein